ncbi:MAG: hypothetical protein EAZ55_02745 [Cytophagales bacterium]|nr:MAG: hypothetical protein EAZ55_02745 [Cytophagales bacterium]
MPPQKEAISMNFAPNQTIQGQEMVYLFATKLQYIRVILKNGEKRTFFRCDTNGNPLVDTNEEED